MPSISFQYQLINAVMSGKKPFTVRQINEKRPVKAGDTLYIYTGMRTKQCRKHGEHVCAGVLPIKVDFKRKEIYIEGVILDPLVQYWFTTTDIQGSEDDFFYFFEKMNYKKPLVLIIYSSKVYELLSNYLYGKSIWQQHFGKH